MELSINVDNYSIKLKPNDYELIKYLISFWYHKYKNNKDVESIKYINKLLSVIFMIKESGIRYDLLKVYSRLVLKKKIDFEKSEKLYNFVNKNMIKKIENRSNNNYKNKYKCMLSGLSMEELNSVNDCIGVIIKVSNKEFDIDELSGLSGGRIFFESMEMEKLKEKCYFMPIFVDEKNWLISKLWIRAIIDASGLSDNVCTQVIPFLTLSKAFEEKTNDERMFQLIKETCLKIYRERVSESYKFNSIQKFVNQLRAIFDKFNNKKLIFMHIYIAQCLNIVNKMGKEEALKFAQFNLDDEARLSLNNVKSVNINCRELLCLLGESNDKWIDANVKNYIKVRIEEKGDDLMIHKPIEWIPKYKKLPAGGEMLYEKIIKDYRKSGRDTISKYIELISEDDVKIPKDLEELGLDTNEKKLAFSIQCYLTYDEKIRKVYLEKGEYISPFNQQEAEKYLKRIFMDSVTKKLQTEMARVDNNIDNIKTDGMAYMFGSAETIQEAVNALKEVYIGRNIMLYVKQLQNRECPLALEKMILLIEGEYNGKKLYMDSNKWIPGKKNCFRLWRMNHALMDEEEWIIFFDRYGCNHRITNWYDKEYDKIFFEDCFL